MRKIVVMLSISLDGFFEGPNRELTWQLIDQELHQHFNDVIRPMSAFLDGRVTHELMSGYWPTADQEPGASPAVVEFAGIWRGMPKHVFSSTLEAAEWNTTVHREVIASEIETLKQQPGGDMGLSGANLAATFRRLGLVDEYRLYLHPVVLGNGHPLFPAGEPPLNLRLLETRTFRSGVVLVRYAT